MNTNKMIVGSTLILTWALLLSARIIAAAIYASTSVHRSYDGALKEIGWLLPLSAWICFAIGVVVFYVYGGFQKNKIPSATPPNVW